MRRLVQLIQSGALARCFWGCATLAQLTMLLGCELGGNLQDIVEVLGKSGETVDGEGEELITGRFRTLRFDGNEPDGVFVTAIEVPDEAPSRLMIVPYPKGPEACSPGEAKQYAPAQSRPGQSTLPLEARLPFVALAADGTESLRFTNFACEVDGVEVAGSGLPINSDFAAKPGFLAQTSLGELYFVDPWAESSRFIADELEPIANGRLAMFAGAPEPWMWTIEGKTLVARDNAFRVQGRTGEDVDQVHVLTDETGPVVVYHQRNNEIYKAPLSDLSARELIEADGCEINADSKNGLRLFYYSPCATRNLVLREVDFGTRRVLAEGVNGYRIIDERSDGPVLLYVTSETTSTVVGTLWARFGEQSPVKIADQGHLSLTRMTTEGELKAMLDWGETGGTLSRGEVGKELEVLARDVIYYTSFGIIADWDGTSGTLHQFEEDELVPIQEGVTNQGLLHDPVTKRALVLVDYDGVEGELTLIRDGRATPLSKGVGRNSYQFTVQLPTVTILSDLDEHGTATLKLRETDSELETIVSEGVSEVLEVNWPDAGFLYSVPEGDRSGIWFTQVR